MPDPQERKQLHIALVIKNFVTTGGAEKYAVEIARRLLDRGHTIDLYARYIDHNLTSGMQVFQVPDKLNFSSVLSLYSFSREAAKLLQGRSYDIIHTHDKGCPGQVSTLHTFSFKRGINRMSWLKKINEFVISPRAWLYLYMEKQQAASDMLVPVSDVIRRDLKECHGREIGVSVIPPGVDVERFCPQEVALKRETARGREGLGDDELAVVFVGSEYRRKGLDRLIPALGEDMRLFVVGRGERIDHYQALTERHGLSDRVRFTGLVADVMDYYALADVVVLPSIAEAFGMTVLEGMACGLPVITSQEAGAACVVESGKTGLVFESPDDIEQMLVSLKDPELRKKLGIQARSAALNCTWDKAADDYEALFYRILKGGTGGPG